MSPVAPDPLKVLYIAGVSHCGSTLLGALLGQAEGVFFAGELAHAARALELDERCGCGELLRECPVWREVFARAPSDGLRLDHSDERARAIVRHLLRERGLARPSARLAGAVDAFGAALRAISETTGARVVVDSSKSPAYGRLLESVPEIELYVLHLVRDPRATAWSWQKEPMLKARPPAVALIWDTWNPIIELLWGRRQRYLRLRYEDFATRPEHHARRIFELLGERPDPLPFVGDDCVELAPTHSVSGNPNRTRSGRVPIRLDDEWLRRPEFRGRRAVSTLTLPLRLRYRYSARPAWT